MLCGQCEGIERTFSDRQARRKLRSYRKLGPAVTTRLLVEALKDSGVEGMTHLDIGGGIGAIQHALLEAGAIRATSVEASSAFASASMKEAERRGVLDRLTFHRGNFVDLADSLDPHDVVTLDRVICCYHDMHALVRGSAGKASRLMGLVYPRDRWWMRVFAWLGNLVLRLIRNPFRTYVHPTVEVEAILGQSGFTRRSYQRTLLWQVVVFER